MAFFSISLSYRREPGGPGIKKIGQPSWLALAGLSAWAPQYG